MSSDDQKKYELLKRKVRNLINQIKMMDKKEILGPGEGVRYEDILVGEATRMKSFSGIARVPFNRYIRSQPDQSIFFSPGYFMSGCLSF
jgi:hypothetical protein